MMELSNIIKLNNNAVALMASGDFQGSTSSLQRALCLVRSTLDQPDSIGIPHPGCSEKSSLITSVDLPEIVHLPGISNETIFVTFNRGIVFGEAMASSSSLLTERQWHIISSALMYNFALTQHKLWERDGVSKRLTKALAFYENAMSLIAPTSAQDYLGADETLLLLAIANNSAYIHSSQFFNFVETQRLIEVMKYLLHSGDMSEIENEDFDDLLMTISLHEVDEKPAAGVA